jgi:hypothetical protein
LLQKSNLSILAIHNLVFFFHQVKQYSSPKKKLERKTIQGHKCKTKHFPQTTRVRDFSQSKDQGLVKNIFNT